MDERVPFLADVSYGPQQPLHLQGWEPTRGESGVASFKYGLSHNPVPAIYRHNELAESMLAGTGFEEQLYDDYGMGANGLEIMAAGNGNSARLSKEEQEKRIREAGFEGRIKPNGFYTAETLQLILEAANEADYNRQIMEMSQHGFTDFMAGLSAGFLDPLNIAASLVPVPGMGAARAAGWLGKAGGFGGRTAIRIGQGAASGALGMALVEPVIAAGQHEIQADYTMAQSLQNIAFGVIMGGALHPVAGGFKEAWARKHGLAQPWEYVPSSGETEALRLEMAERWKAAFEGAVPDADMARAGKFIDDLTLLYDQAARRGAYLNQMSGVEAWKAIDVDALNGEAISLMDAELKGDALLDAIDKQTARNAELEAKVFANEQLGSEALYGDMYRQDRNALTWGVERRAFLERQAKAQGVDMGNRQTLFQRSANAVQGNETAIQVGQNFDKAHYEVWELDDVLASHDPLAGFQRTKGYPAFAQERQYHALPDEQSKVQMNARQYNAARTVNDNPTAIEGPPIITDQGIVLGGNSRAMSLKILYHEGNAPKYVDTLKQNAGRFGIDAGKIDGMKKPVLVRVLDEKLDDSGLARKSREYNQTDTMALSAEAEAVSRGKFFTRELLAEFSAGIKDYDSFNSYLANQNTRELSDKLIAAGLIDQAEAPKFITKEGALNADGIKRLRNALVGRAVQDFDVLAGMSEGLREKVEVAVPAMTRISALPDAYNLSGALRDALRLVNRAKANKWDLGVKLAQQTLGENKTPTVVEVLAILMDRAKPQEIRTRFEAFAREAEKGAAPQNSLLGGPAGPTPDAAFGRAFLSRIGVIDGKPLLRFNPEKNTLHAAIEKLAKKSGKFKSVNEAIAEMNKRNPAKMKPVDRQRFMEMQAELGKHDGSFAFFDSNLGKHYSIAKDADLTIPKPDQVNVEPEAPVAPVPQPAANAGAAAPKPEPERVTLGDVRGSTTFEGRKAIVRFFKTADIDTAAHELAHVLRRQQEALAKMAGASERMRRAYAQIEDKFGVTDGKWSVEQEEAFAEQFVSYLRGGADPDPMTATIFTAMRNELVLMYGEADAAGLDVSPEVRQLFNQMVTVPIAEGKWQFNRALAELVSGRWADMDSQAHLNQLRRRASLTPEDIERINGAADRELEREIVEMQSGLQSMLDDADSIVPATRRAEIASSVNQDLAPLNTEIERINMPETREFVRDFLACIV